jgi:hypothetical protein
MAYVLGRAGSTSPGMPIGLVGLAMAVFELLAYQARYMINDLLDRDLDAGHPAAAQRPRLPEGLTHKQLTLVACAAGSRVVVALLVVATALPQRLMSPILLAILGIFVISFPYELTRQAIRLRQTSTITVRDLSRLNAVSCLVYLLVSFGYALRIALGLTLASGPNTPLVLTGVAFAVPFGMMFVSMTWAIEGTSFISRDWTGIDPAILQKSHLGPLLYQAGALPLPLEPPQAPPTAVAVLLTAPRYLTVWNVTLILAAIAAAPFGLLLADRPHSPSVGLMLFAVGACLVAATLVASRARRSAGLFALAFTSLAPLGALIGAVTQTVTRPLLTIVPIAILIGVAVTFRLFNFDTLNGINHRTT